MPTPDYVANRRNLGTRRDVETLTRPLRVVAGLDRDTEPRVLINGTTVLDDAQVEHLRQVLADAKREAHSMRFQRIAAAEWAKEQAERHARYTVEHWAKQVVFNAERAQKQAQEPKFLPGDIVKVVAPSEFQGTIAKVEGPRPRSSSLRLTVLAGNRAAEDSERYDPPFRLLPERLTLLHRP